MLCSQVQLARVVVCVLVLVDVVCVMIVVLIAHVDVVHAVDTVLVAIFVVIFCNWRCILSILFFLEFSLVHARASHRLCVSLSRILSSTVSVSGCLHKSCKAQHRTFSPPRPLMKDSHTTCGIP